MEDRLVHKVRKRINGETYSISVYCRSTGMLYAKTCLGHSDIITNSGSSIVEVLKEHKDILPLAVSSHLLRKSLQKMMTPDLSPTG